MKVVVQLHLLRLLQLHLSNYGPITFQEKMIAEQAAWQEAKQGFGTEIQALNMHVMELQRSKEV